MRLILLGAPGAGKGTQANLLQKQLGVNHISMGDILRAEMKNNTPLGQEVKKYVESGGLVPDEVVIKIIENNLKEKAIATSGYMLDGFPRTAKQAEALSVILKKIGQPVDYVIYMEVDPKIVVARLTGRRVCRKCAAVYHIKNMPSKKEGVCDKCQGELYQRPDDVEETIRKRINVYLESTAPIIDYYKAQKTLLAVDGNQDAEKLRDELMQIFKKDGKVDTPQNKKRN